MATVSYGCAIVVTNFCMLSIFLLMHISGIHKGEKGPDQVHEQRSKVTSRHMCTVKS